MPAPTAERLKVRCYRCNQLLAVAPFKAGSVVACPKCKAELLIPRGDTPPPPAESSDPGVTALKSGTYPALAPGSSDSPPSPTSNSGAPPSSFLDEIAAMIPPELAALRPEDLRVEAEFFGKIAREPAPPRPAEPAPSMVVEEPFQFPLDFTGREVPAPAAPTIERIPEAVAAGPGTTAEAAFAGPGAVEVPPPLPVPPVGTRPVTEAAIVVPPISIEHAPIRPAPDAEPRVIREVVLPVPVVLAWMLIVLLSIPMTFLAGLMIGHFLWKAGP